MARRRIVLICKLVDDADTVVPSVKRLCPDCYARVWVSETMRPHLKADGMEPLCKRCAREVARNNDNVEMGVHPAQEKTLDALGLLGLVRQQVIRVNNGRVSLVELLDALDPDTLDDSRAD